MLVCRSPGPGLGYRVARFLLGVTQSSTYPAAGRSISRWVFPANRALANALVIAGISAGSALTARFVGLLKVEFGWRDGRFRAWVRSTATTEPAPAPATPDDPLAATFDGPVVPEATPNPRTIRFGFGHPVNDGPSRWYPSPPHRSASSNRPRRHCASPTLSPPSLDDRS